MGMTGTGGEEPTKSSLLIQLVSTQTTVGIGPKGDSLTPAMTQPRYHYMPYGAVFQSSRKQRDEIPSESSEAGETSEGRNPIRVFRGRGNLRGALVTFYPSGTRRPQGIEDPAQEAETKDIEDVLHKSAERRWDLIPVHLERRLSGGYDPVMHPDEISEERWMERLGVARYELAGLRDAYGR